MPNKDIPQKELTEQIDKIVDTIIDKVHFECKYNVLEGLTPDYTKIDSYAKSQLLDIVNQAVAKKSYVEGYLDGVNSFSRGKKYIKDRIKELGGSDGK